MMSPAAQDLDDETLLQRLDEILAVLHAIDEGALLADAPRDAGAQRRHQSATVLVDVVRAKLQDLRSAVRSKSLAGPNSEPRPGAASAEAKAGAPVNLHERRSAS